VAANTPFTISVSGTAPPPPQEGAGGGDPSQDPSINSRAESGGGAPTATATTLPARLDGLKWTIAAGFVAIFALGLAFLWRRPEMSLDPAGESAAVAGPRQKRSRSKAAAAEIEAEIELNQKVQGSLDELKETLFRLELRRQAGTIGEEDYEREHARVQKHLRDLVKG
jgi:hypothetical protein